MHSRELFLATMATASSALASQIPTQTAVVGFPHFGALLKAPAPTAVVRRQTKDTGDAELTSCLNKFWPEFEPEEPKDGDLAKFISTNKDEFACSVTVPASLSSQYLSLQSAASDFYSTAQDKLQEITKCGVSTYELPIDLGTTEVCDSSHTVFFTGKSGTSSTVFPAWTIPTLLTVGDSTASSGGETPKSKAPQSTPATTPGSNDSQGSGDSKDSDDKKSESGKPEDDPKGGAATSLWSGSVVGTGAALAALVGAVLAM